MFLKCCLREMLGLLATELHTRMYENWRESLEIGGTGPGQIGVKISQISIQPSKTERSRLDDV